MYEGSYQGGAEKEEPTKKTNYSNKTFLDGVMFMSPAYRKLTKNGHTVLLAFLFKRKVTKKGRSGKETWVVINNGEIVFTYTEAQKKYHIHRGTFRDALGLLIELGFIDISHQGGALAGDCTTYSISNRWRGFGEKGFNKKVRSKDKRQIGFAGENWKAKRSQKMEIETSARKDTGIETATSEIKTKLGI